MGLSRFDLYVTVWHRSVRITLRAGNVMKTIEKNTTKNDYTTLNKVQISVEILVLF